MNYDFEFNSLNDWSLIDQQLRRQVHNIYNYEHKRQMIKMLANLHCAIGELSQAEIDMRRTGYDKTYLAKLATVREELAHLQQWMMFAVLVDTKPEE